MNGARPVSRLAFGPGPAPGSRMLAEEVAVALTFNGSTQAVMMATPDDLVDFAYGFALTEGIARPEEILSVEVETLPQGRDVQVWLRPEAEARLAARRRTMAGPVGCGLCGIDSLDQALRPLPLVPASSFRMAPAEVMAAVAALPNQQRLHDATRAVHCAAWWTPPGILAAREDVGRHNALDKLCGHLIRHPRPDGAVVITSRVSIDLVQKVVLLGAPVLIAVSAPTADAVALADTAGLCLIALARPDRFEVFTHTDRLLPEPIHVR